MKNTKKRYLEATMLIFFLISSLTYAYSFERYLYGVQRHTLSNEQKQAYDWILKNTNPSTKILTYDVHYGLQVITQRNVISFKYLWSSNYLSLPVYIIFTSQSAEIVLYILKRLNIDYIYITTKELNEILTRYPHSIFPYLLSVFETVFSCDEISIYSVSAHRYNLSLDYLFSTKDKDADIIFYKPLLEITNNTISWQLFNTFYLALLSTNKTIDTISYMPNSIKYVSQRYTDLDELHIFLGKLFSEQDLLYALNRTKNLFLSTNFPYVYLQKYFNLGRSNGNLLTNKNFLVDVFTDNNATILKITQYGTNKIVIKTKSTDSGLIYIHMPLNNSIEISNNDSFAKVDFSLSAISNKKENMKINRLELYLTDIWGNRIMYEYNTTYLETESIAADQGNYTLFLKIDKQYTFVNKSQSFSFSNITAIGLCLMTKPKYNLTISLDGIYTNLYLINELKNETQQLFCGNNEFFVQNISYSLMNNTEKANLTPILYYSSNKNNRIQIPALYELTINESNSKKIYIFNPLYSLNFNNTELTFKDYIEIHKILLSVLMRKIKEKNAYFSKPYLSDKKTLDFIFDFFDPRLITLNLVNNITSAIYSINEITLTGNISISTRFAIVSKDYEIATYGNVSKITGAGTIIIRNSAYMTYAEILLVNQSLLSIHFRSSHSIKTMQTNDSLLIIVFNPEISFDGNITFLGSYYLLDKNANVLYTNPSPETVDIVTLQGYFVFNITLTGNNLILITVTTFKVKH